MQGEIGITTTESRYVSTV